MKFILFQLLFWSTSLLFSQTNSNSFSGYIQLQDNSKIPFHLKFEVNNNTIQGVSIADEFGLNETKSTILGFVDNNTFYINEMDVMYSLSDAEENEFCLLQMTLKEKIQKDIRYLNGNFKGIYNDSLICAYGEVLLIDSLSFANSTKQIVKKIKESQRTQKKIKTITKEDGLSFATEKETLTIELWDNGKLDNDSISIYHNQNLILNKYELQRKKKQLKITLEKGVNFIDIKAENTGLYAPNTARIQLKGTHKSYNAVTHLKAQEITRIKIKHN
jgi:hypothetical protein